MRKRNWLIVILMLLLLSACGQSATSGTAEDDNVIKIGATPDGYPQYYYENNELEGFSVDMIEAIFAEIGYEVEWVVTDWTGVLASLETGKIDTVANFAQTPEREEKYSFTEAYYYSRAALGVAKDNDTIHSLEDVKGKQVGNVTGSNYQNVLKENDPNDEIEIINYETADVIHQDVASGKVDAFVTGREILLAQIKDKGIPLQVVGEAFGEKLVSLPFAKTEENEALIAEINEAVETLRADGTFQDLSMEWFDEDVTISQDEQ
ncbi:transporter substrate-binding domain-containing protein [Oceanobacillus polygoni]|uniref:Amino-acid transport system substrate-binding protein n=1 Tax=Oceanobacillus polygoni TaxID=1235259 RepID=A0A9X1CBH1_9BACI|nr:transporter substrate-binding domain-containing protein [Oceanobacillus polygoni]MBP2076946.1 putative amino-acid transport system substrate-binding protein [Oceanobacillus polygoni]